MTGAPGPSRAATDALLAGLRDGGWGPRAWLRFAAGCAARSAGELRRHPRAAAQLTALHLGYALAARPGRRAWPAASWALTVTHLGMLEGSDRLGPANLVTLTRAQLPALRGGRGRWLAPAALASDRLDGALARRYGITPFGRYADSLADAAFWTWVAVRREPDARVRAAALAAWAAPVAAVSAASFARGRMIDPPRPVLLRPAAALQAVLAARALARPATGTRRPSARAERPEGSGRDRGFRRP